MPSIHSKRFAVLLVVSVVGVLCFTLATTVMLIQAGIHGQLYRQILDAQDLSSAIEPPPLYLVEAMLVAHEIADQPDQPAQLARFNQLVHDFAQQEAQWNRRLSDPKAAEALHRMAVPAHQFISCAEERFVPAVQRGDRLAAKALLDGPLTAAFTVHRQQVVALLELLKHWKQQTENQAQNLQFAGSLGLVATLLVVFGASWGLFKVRGAHQQEIRQREARMRLLGEAAFEGIAVTDGTKVVDGNQPLAALLGLRDVPAVIGVSLLGYIAPEQHSGFLSSLAQKQEGDHELRLVRGDGTVLDVEVRSRNYSEEGKALRLVAFRDITQHKQAQRDLLSFQQHLQELVDQRSRELSLERDRLESYINVSSVLIVVLDLDATIVRINPYGCDLLGRPGAELTGRNWFEACVPPDQRAAAAAYFQSFIADPTRRGAEEFAARTHEHDLACRDGAVRHLLFRNAWLHDATGQVCGTISSAIDITSAREAERALHRAKENAERANRAKSDFLASMSHEIRTPLNAVLGYAQLLQRDTSLDQRHQRAVEVINRSGEHLLSLISDILEMSRIEAGRASRELVACDLHDLLDGLRSLFLLRARDKGLELRLELAADLPKYITTDPQKLRQILTNLVGNAVKFTACGAIALRAEHHAGRLQVAVSDSGVGIADDELPQLFRPFVQVEAGRTRGDGTGLGLAISRGLAEVLGGTLTVSSTPGRGSVFTLAIPAAECAAAAPTLGRSSQVLRVHPDCATPRVLIAEDHADSRQLLHDLMASVGCEVRSVGDGRSAVVCQQTWQPDLVWMDIDMPLMDGLSATAAIRAQQPDPRPTIIALTAAAFAEDRQRILASGCDEVEHKPYREDRLFALMERLAGIRFLRQDEPAGNAAAHPPTGDLAAVRAALAELPAAEQEAFRAALILGDLSVLPGLCLAWRDRSAAATIAHLVETMDIERLMHLLAEPAPAQDRP